MHVNELKETILAKYSPGTTLVLDAKSKHKKWPKRVRLYGLESIKQMVEHFEGENEPDDIIVLEDDVTDEEELENYRKRFVKEIILCIGVNESPGESTISFL